VTPKPPPKTRLEKEADAILLRDVKSRGKRGSHTTGQRRLFKEEGILGPSAEWDLRAGVHEITQDEKMWPTDAEREGARHSGHPEDWEDTPRIFGRGPSAPPILAPDDDEDARVTKIAVAGLLAGLSTEAQWLAEAVNADNDEAVWRAVLGDKTDAALAELRVALAEFADLRSKPNGE
jgi:hypothetical protein